MYIDTKYNRNGNIYDTKLVIKVQHIRHERRVINILHFRFKEHFPVVYMLPPVNLTKEI